MSAGGWDGEGVRGGGGSHGRGRNAYSGRNRGAANWPESGCGPNIPLAQRGLREASGDGQNLNRIERTGGVVKVKASIRRMCNQCQVVRRKGKVRVICKANPKHKQVQG